MASSILMSGTARPSGWCLYATTRTCSDTSGHNSSPDSLYRTRPVDCVAVRNTRWQKPAGANDMTSRMSIPEIADRLSIGRLSVYAMLEQGIIPAIRLGRRWIVTRHAFEAWERTCGTGLSPRPEHKVT